MAKTAPSGPILITGSSSGIGRSSALALHAAGRTVYATARRLESIKDLADQGIRTLALDVTDEESMTTAVEAIEVESGPIGVSSKTGCCPASAMKLSTGSFWSAWKYCRVAEAIWTYR